MNVTGPYTFGPELYRSEQLSAGEHTIQVEADGAVTVRIYTQNAVQMMSSSSTELYNDVAEGTITITVPEEDVKTFFRILAEPQVTVRRVLIDGSMELPLRYKLLPGFAVGMLACVIVSLLDKAPGKEVTDIFDRAISKYND